ncbi:MAG: FIST N-terminal domain-containing protein [Promethearchaeota archaeon]
MKAAVGIHINHDITQATIRALDQAEARLLKKPDLILFFTASHPGGAKVYNRAMSIIRERHQDVPLGGCSGIGIATKDDYGIKGAGIMLLSGIVAKSNVIKRFRIGNRFKTRKVIKNCERTIQKAKEKDGSNTTHIFCPPGLGFPKFMASMMDHKIEGFNPFFALNSWVWRKFSFLPRLTGPLMEFFMNLLGMGISYSSSWPLFTKLYEKGIHFTGNFGADPLTLENTYQFCNFKAYKDSLTYVSISSPELRFESRTDSGAKIMPTKNFEVNSAIGGGFVTKANGKWGRDALLELIDMTETQDVLEENLRKYFYYHPYRPLCVIDDENNQNTYALSINPNINHALVTAPNQVVNKLHANDPHCYKAYICDQSASLIEDMVDETLTTTITPDTSFSLIFECANRSMIIGEKYGDFVEKYSKHFKETPFLIVISGGEINSQKFPIVNFSAVTSTAKLAQ